MALAQRWHTHRGDVEAIPEVLAKGPGRDHLLEAPMRGRDHPGVDGALARLSDAAHRALLQHAGELGLQRQAHVADLVEKERAAFGLLEASGRALAGAGKGALLVVEEFALDQFAGDRGHVDGDEGAIAPAPVIMQRAGDEFLAGTALARNHDREIRLHQPREHAVDVLHRRRTPDQRDLLVLFRRLARDGGLARCRHRAVHHADQFVEVEGFRQIFVSAALRRRDRRLQRVLRAHDDNRKVRPRALDARDEIEGIFVGHDHVGDDEIALALAHPAPQRRRVAGRTHLVADPAERLVEHGADRRIVIRKENGSAWHWPLLSPSALRAPLFRRHGSRSRPYAWAATRGKWFCGAGSHTR